MPGQQPRGACGPKAFPKRLNFAGKFPQTNRESRAYLEGSGGVESSYRVSGGLGVDSVEDSGKEAGVGAELSSLKWTGFKIVELNELSDL